MPANVQIAQSNMSQDRGNAASMYYYILIQHNNKNIKKKKNMYVCTEHRRTEWGKDELNIKIV